MQNQVISQNDHSQWIDLLSQIESFIVQGLHANVKQILNTVNPKKIPRKLKVDFATIAWRANLYLFVLKILQDVIYPDNSFNAPATTTEKIIYASSLSSLGVTNEAIELFQQTNSIGDPSVLFHLASAYMFNWNYSKAIPFLKKYIHHNDTTEYQKIVGRVNLAAAYIHQENWSDADQLLDLIQIKCEEQSFQLLLGNCFELKAQIEIFQGNYASARTYLDKAFLYLKNQSGHYLMYVKKWQAVCDCLDSKNSSDKTSAVNNLAQIKNMAFQLKHWNTLRECDLFEAITNKNNCLFKKVIMGTPSEQYRQRARRLFNNHNNSNGRYLYLLKPADCDLNENSNLVFDPLKRLPTGETLSNKPLLFSLFQTLTLDFYQPQTLSMIFQKVYVNERFNPFTSPTRVLQLLRRLNSWFAVNKLPLKIDFIKSEFQISSSVPIYIAVYRGQNKPTVKKAKIFELKERFSTHKFTIQDTCQTLKVSKATAERLISKAFSEGLLKKERIPKGVVYRFTTKQLAKKTAA